MGSAWMSGYGVRGKLEPLRAKLTELADLGWLHKRGDGMFTARP
ncbi:hypothetical protein [Streptomyces silvisoli]|uniref:Dam-replacing protein HTH domain-containing protein n=1 Tax=Streptomyces silvisoli TaxID=3034235 RepID=A0ABT5ZWY9_9ACTN|nr:hypothetical protein [Streptomyces silvisoli]MDF3294346.1 hypothetical protein [Streptomyces silvisoli]